jgi:hypothetical protein
MNVKLIILVSCFFLVNLNAQKSLTRKLNSFDKLELFGSIEVYLKQGEVENVRISTKDADLNNVTIKENATTLKIATVEELFDDKKTVKVEITYKVVRDVDASGGAQVNFESVLKGDKLIINSGSGAQLYLSVDVNALEATVGQGALIVIDGKAKSQVASANTGGVYSAYKLKSEDAYINANTGGKAKITASNILEASANTGGYIGYSGDAKNKKIKQLLGGEVVKNTEPDEL